MSKWGRIMPRWRHALAETIEREIDRQEAQERVREATRRAKVPLLCEWLICLLVDPEFQKDRLGDYEERFADLWVPKFGRQGAVVVYVWHVLRQARLIDWLIRAFGWGDLL